MNADGRPDLGLSTGDLFMLEESGIFCDVTPFNGIGRVDLFTWMNLLRTGADFPGGLANRWLEVDLAGTVSNRSAVGAIAVLYAGNIVATDAVSEAPPDAGILYFGLGEESREGSVSNQHVNLTVYDLRGRQVRGLVSEPLGSGRHRVTWDGRDRAGRPVASGVYMCRMTSGGKSAVTKMIVQK